MVRPQFTFANCKRIGDTIFRCDFTPVLGAKQDGIVAVDHAGAGAKIEYVLANDGTRYCASGSKKPFTALPAGPWESADMAFANNEVIPKAISAQETFYEQALGIIGDVQKNPDEYVLVDANKMVGIAKRDAISWFGQPDKQYSLWLDFGTEDGNVVMVFPDYPLGGGQPDLAWGVVTEDSGVAHVRKTIADLLCNASVQKSSLFCDESEANEDGLYWIVMVGLITAMRL